MRELKITTLLDLSFDRTKTLLLKPFRLTKWMKLSLIALLSGSFSWGISLPPVNPSINLPLSKYIPTIHLPSQMIFLYLTALTVFVAVFFIWFAAHFTILWTQSIMDNTTEIRKNLIKNKTLGNSLFMFNFRLIFYTLLSWMGIAFLILKNFTVIAMTIKTFPIWSIVFFISFLLIEIIILGLITFLTSNFIVPIMIIDQCTLGEGWKKFFPIMKQYRKDFWIFLFVSILISMISSIVAGIILLSSFIAFLIIGAIIILPLYLFFILFLKWKFMLLLVGGITGLLVLSFFCVFMLLYLSFPTFTKNFSLYFLSSLKCGYTPIPLTSKSGDPA